MLQTKQQLTPSVIIVSGPGAQFGFTLANFSNYTGTYTNLTNGTTAQANTLYQSHQLTDLRASLASSNSSKTASLSFDAKNNSRAVNQLTILIPGNTNSVNLQFSESCLFPAFAYAQYIAGLQASTGDVTDATKIPSWYTQVSSDSFSMNGDLLGIRGLSSSRMSSLSVEYPNYSKDNARNLGAYNQTIYFGETYSSYRSLLVYCPLIDSIDGSWSVKVAPQNITVVTPTPSPTPTPTPTPTNGTTNNTAQVETNTSTDSGYNKAALIVGLVLGILLLLALAAIAWLCCKLRRKSQENDDFVVAKATRPAAVRTENVVLTKPATRTETYTSNDLGADDYRINLDGKAETKLGKLSDKPNIVISGGHYGTNEQYQGNNNLYGNE